MPINIVIYAILIHVVASQVKLQLSREPRPYPELKISQKPATIIDYRVAERLVGARRLSQRDQRL